MTLGPFEKMLSTEKTIERVKLYFKTICNYTTCFVLAGRIKNIPTCLNSGYLSNVLIWKLPGLYRVYRKLLPLFFVKIAMT